MQKNIIFHDVVQNSDGWFNLRLGKFTASKCKDLLSSKSTAAYSNLINQIVFERLTGERPESFKSDWMLRGSELEPIAIEQYELSTFNKTHNGGFFELNEWVGASPDGIIGNEGQLQVKCPSYSTHIDYLYKGIIPSDYYNQVQFEMMCTGRNWCDLFFFHPKLKVKIHRINRNEETIKTIESQLEIAIEKVKEIISKIN